MIKHKPLKILLSVSLMFLACTPNLNNTKNNSTISSTKKQIVAKKGLSIIYQDSKGKSFTLTKDDLISYKIGNTQKTEFGCSGCLSIENNSITYNGKEAVTFIVKNPAKKFSTKAEGDDVSVTVPYNIYKSTDEEFNNNGLVYNIKQKLKSEKKRFTEQAVSDETVFEIAGGTLDNNNQLTNPISFKYSDEKNMLIYTNNSKVSTFDEQELQNGNTTPKSIRDQTQEEKNLINNIKDSLNTVLKDVLKVDQPEPDPSATPSNKPISSPESSITPSPIASKECIVKFKPSDLPLNPFLEKQLKDQNCKVVVQ